MRTLTAIVSLMLLTTGSIAAQDGLALMRVETGARPAGMGGAFVAAVAVPDAALYNPAGIYGVQSLAASFGHTAYWENIRLESGYVAAPMSERLAVYGGIRWAAIDELEKRGDSPTTEPLGMFDSHDASFKGGLAYRINDRITAGAALGWFFEKIDASAGWAFNVDLGLSAIATENLAVGASVTGLGSDLVLQESGRDDSDPIPLPTTYRAGGMYTFGRLVGAADFVYINDDAHAHLGVELFAHELFQLRSGYMTGYDTKNFTAGASFVQRNLTVDYAFVPYTKDLGSTHTFNLTFTL